MEVLEEGALDQKNYELSFLIKEEDSTSLKKILGVSGITIISERPLQKVHLAYPIKKTSNAYLGSVYFKAAPSVLNHLSSELKLQSDILRGTINLILSEHSFSDQKVAFESREPAKEKRRPIFQREPKKTYDTALTNEALEKTIKEISK